jgi:hypothetical protein
MLLNPNNNNSKGVGERFIRKMTPDLPLNESLSDDLSKTFKRNFEYATLDLVGVDAWTLDFFQKVRSYSEAELASYINTLIENNRN